MRGAQSLLIRARLGGEDGKVITTNGRAAWALDQLIQAGTGGLPRFPIRHPGGAIRYGCCGPKASSSRPSTNRMPAPLLARTPATSCALPSSLERTGVTAPPPAPVPTGAPLEYGRSA